MRTRSHILSYLALPILFYLILPCVVVPGRIASYPFLPDPKPSYPILPYHVPSYPIMCRRTLFSAFSHADLFCFLILFVFELFFLANMMRT